MGLKGLHAHIRDIDTYLQKVVAGQLPINHQVVMEVQMFIAWLRITKAVAVVFICAHACWFQNALLNI